MKTLADVKDDLSEQYDLVKSGKMEIQLSAELSNIHGKFIRADALEYAKEQYADQLSRKIIAVEAAQIEHA